MPSKQEAGREFHKPNVRVNKLLQLQLAVSTGWLGTLLPIEYCIALVNLDIRISILIFAYKYMDPDKCLWNEFSTWMDRPILKSLLTTPSASLWGRYVYLSIRTDQIWPWRIRNLNFKFCIKCWIYLSVLLNFTFIPFT